MSIFMPLLVSSAHAAITNGDFSNGLNGWTALSGNGTVSEVGGQAVLTSGVSLGSIFTLDTGNNFNNTLVNIRNNSLRTVNSVNLHVAPMAQRVLDLSQTSIPSIITKVDS